MLKTAIFQNKVKKDIMKLLVNLRSNYFVTHMKNAIKYLKLKKMLIKNISVL